MTNFPTKSSLMRGATSPSFDESATSTLCSRGSEKLCFAE